MSDMRIMKIIAVITVGLVMPLATIAQSTNQNYILKKTYTAANVGFDDIQNDRRRREYLLRIQGQIGESFVTSPHVGKRQIRYQLHL